MGRRPFGGGAARGGGRTRRCAVAMDIITGKAGARAVEALADAALGGGVRLGRRQGFADGTAVASAAARRASVDGAQHRDGRRDAEAAAGTTPAGSSVSGACAKRGGDGRRS